MRRYYTALCLSLVIPIISLCQQSPHITIFPPQMHQQICLESTYTRILQVSNSGDSTLEYLASFVPWGNVPASTVKYCKAQGDCDAFIDRVITGQIDTVTGCNNGYGDFTSLIALFVVGEPTAITVIPGGNSLPTDECGVWTDWNQDGEYTADELVILSGSPGTGPYTGTIIPPSGAKNGSTGMRIILSRGALAGPCVTSSVGEAEDFTANVISWAFVSPLSGTVEPGDTSEMQFDFNSAGLPVSNYYVNLHFTCNDPETPEIDVLTMLHVQTLNILINPEQDSICSGCSTLLKTSVFGCSEAYSFNWTSDPPGFSSTEKSPVVSPTVTTTYTVTVTDGNYSEQKSVLIKTFGSSSGIDDNSLFSGVSIYPNPCDEICTLKFISEYSGEGIIRINDLRGAVTQTVPVSIRKGLNEQVIRTAGIVPGAYLFSVLVNNSIILVTGKIFIL
jgi:hypothetical protein